MNSSHDYQQSFLIAGTGTLDRGREGGRCYNDIRNKGENVWFELRSKDDVGSNN